MRRAILAAVLVALSTAASGLAQSISVFSHTTIVAGQRALSECGTTMNDLQVQNNYPSVITWCGFYRGSTEVGEFQCPPGSNSRCSSTFNTIPGEVYSTTASHGLSLYQVPAQCTGFWDPFRFCHPAGVPAPEFRESGVLTARSPAACWSNQPCQLAFTFGNNTPTFFIVPAQAEIPPGQTVTFAGPTGTPRCRLVSGPGTVNTATCTYNAPASISGTQTAVVEGCNVNNLVDCANATVTVRSATVTVTPGTQEVIPGTAGIPLKATVSPSSFPQTVTWRLSPTGIGNIDANGVYTAPPNETLPGLVRLTATACSTVDTTACGTAIIDVPKVLITVSGTTPFLATSGATQTLGANVTGPATPQEVDWTPGTAGSIVSIGFNTARYTAPTPPPTQTTTTQVKACMKKNLNICGAFDLTLVPPVTITSPGTWQAGMTNNVTITGTGFGTSPEVSLSNAAIVFTLGARSNTSISLQANVPVSLGGQVLTVTVRNPVSGLNPQASANATITKATLAISPPSATLREGQSQTFSTTCTAGGAACTGLSSVAWTATAGTITPNGFSATYTAPASVASTTNVTVSACWAAGQCATASVTVPPITVTVSPTPVNVNGCSTRQFTAQVSNAPVSTVTWSITPQVGAIDTNGLYTAPCPVTAQTVVTVRACSTANSEKCGTATATLVPISVVVQPASLSVQAGSSAQLSAVVQGTTNTGVTWSISPNTPAAGSIDQNGLYRAPSALTTVTSVTVTATSKADNATAGNAQISLVVSSAVLNPTSLTFAAQDVNTTSAAQAVTLSNTGTAALSISSIVVSGEFLQSNNCGTSLAPNAACTINVQFRPLAIGTRTGTLTVASNAPGSPSTASLTGTGRGPTASLSPNSLDFGGQRAGFSTATQRVTLANTGTGAMSISGISVSADFTQSNNCGTSLAAGASCFINVAFSPAATSSGLRTGVLQVTTNAPGSPHTSTLSGRVLGGFHDYNNCDGATGWAWDSSQPNTSINVYVFEGSTLLGSVPANKYRADLPGNRYHAFDWMLPGSMRDGVEHVITIRFSPDPNAVPIPGSPKSLTCAPEPNLQGYHDTATCDGVTGWAWDASQPYTPITVYFFEGTQPLGSMVADMHRQDLANSGIGDGRHAFVWPIPAGLRDGQPHNISVLFENSWAAPSLVGSPQTITCGGPDGTPCGGDGHHTWRNNQCVCTDCGSPVCCGSSGNSFCDGQQIQDPNTGYTGACASSLPSCGPANDFSGDDELYHDGDIFACVKQDGVHEWFPRRPSPRCQEAGSTCTYLCAYNLAGGQGFMCESGGWWSQNPPLPYCYGGTVPEHFKCN